MRPVARGASAPGPLPVFARRGRSRLLVQAGHGALPHNTWRRQGGLEYAAPVHL
ncbi:Hypothetical protein SCLAV_p0338 (plasmid) [Streptomyces clavuligerus]|uniref:Uncharacterized protein n=1 Tax=Streptomyces clavuligerus TaxID=1901 RepID=B5GS40_STRCL|nr:hypothetical protein SSCG_02164 [Streptomyces clavuligerus]EFG03829.1 Hypothetical protein SCLAV_p0338 [Streptomyces clavuligerus]